MLTAAALGACLAWASLWLLPWQPHRPRECFEPAPELAERDLAAVGVVIPARNEAAHLPATLACLAQQGPNLRVLVVDDESTDQTAAVLEELADSLRTPPADEGRYALDIVALRGQPLPAGWGGKLWALQQGFGHNDRPFTLLLDADIELDRGVLPSLMAAAHERGVQLMSVMAMLRVANFWERLLVPPFIFFFKLLYPFAWVNSARCRLAAAAGGCILVETRVLQSQGGFKPIRDALIDDCSLAAAVKRQGHSTWLGLSHAVTSTRAYDRLGDFWDMVRRTAFTQLKYSLALLLLTSTAMLWLFLVPLAALLWDPISTPGAVALAAWLAMSLAYAPIVRYYRLPLSWSLTLPVAGLLFLAMTWDSAWGYWRGTRARWKNRCYEVSEN